MIRKQSLASYSSVLIVVGQPLAEMVGLVFMALLKIMELGSTMLIRHGWFVCIYVSATSSILLLL